MIQFPDHDLVHRILSSVVEFLGYHLGTELPMWLHPVLHLILIWAPLALLLVIVVKGVSLARKGLLRARAPRSVRPSGFGVEPSVVRYILQRSARSQLGMMALGLATMPVLYATFELPKEIINNAIDSNHFPIAIGSLNLVQVDYLIALSILFLLAHLLSSSLKYVLNVYKGRVGERVTRHLRLVIYARWRRGAGGAKRSEVLPLIAQEAEPVGGFAAEAFALPAFQGGTFVTIMVFMFVQDPILGAAAVTLLPVQLAIIPALQRRINRLTRRRVAYMRTLGGTLGDQAAGAVAGGRAIRDITQNFKDLQRVRQELHRIKFLVKSLNNFLNSLTPFFFYMIGGYLVIDGRLSLGALVAVLAAHKDLSAPLRELLTYYQQIEDVRTRYAEILGYLGAPSTAAAVGAEASMGQRRSRPVAEPVPAFSS